MIIVLYLAFKSEPVLKEITRDFIFMKTIAALLLVFPSFLAFHCSSGVGASSMTTAYGYNRMDYSYIPGGVVSGTALIRPDFPELKNFPYLWQQAEYVMGEGATHFMFLVLAADHLLQNGSPDRP